jgi:O-acetyl-ADP-ribose deacetylase (regulator of RNase III)
MEYKPGADIFTVGAECLINPVNCQAHKLSPGWQKGLAGAFEAVFPEVQVPFKKVCREGKMKPGSVQMVCVDSKTGRRSREGDLYIANFATKDHWRERSKIEAVDRGLGKLAKAIDERGIRSVAIPQLGSGLGGLPWSDVRQSIEKHFAPLAEKGVGVIVLGESLEQERARLESPEIGRINIDEPKDAVYIAGIGARDTPDSVLRKMQAVSEILAKKDCILRSGGAHGADEFCEKGWDAAGGRKQIFLSWRGMNDRQPNGKDVFSFDYREGDPETEIAKKYYHRSEKKPNGDLVAWRRLGRGGRAHMSRNTNQVLGPNIGKSPITSAILCYTEAGIIKGGTGQALRLAQDKGIPVINLGDRAFKGLDASQIAQVTMDVVGGKDRDAALEAVRVSKRKKQDMGRE